MGIDPMLRLSQSRVLPLHHNHHKLERVEDFETSTCSLATNCSASELYPQKMSGVRESNSQQQIGNL